MKRAIIVALALCTVAHADDDEDMGRRVQLLLRAHQADVFGCVAKEQAKGEAFLRIVVGGEHVPEVLKADPSVQRTAECVALAARRWDVSSLGASAGDQIVFPLVFTPEPPDHAALGARMQLVSLRRGQILSVGVDTTTALFVVKGALTDLRAGDLRWSSGVASSLTATSASTVLKVEARAGAPLSKTIAHGAALRIDDGPFSLAEVCWKKGQRVSSAGGASDELLYIERGRATTMLGTERVKTRAGELLTIPRGTTHTFSIEQDLCALQVFAPGVAGVTSAPPAP